jgi:phage antirepressor YoqD-like protein
MEVRVCKNCRRLFKYIYGPELCQDCLKLVAQERAYPEKKVNSIVKPLVKEEEEKYEQVRDYIMANPKATVAQIAEANDIFPAKLFEWIRDERLEFSDEAENAWFTCEKCGAKIKSGRLCNRCKVR